MPQLKVAVQLSGLGLPFKKAILKAAELGVEAVEIDARWEFRPEHATQTALREIRRLLEEVRLRVSAVSFVTRHGYDEPHGLERRISATHEAMKFAQSLGASLVINQIGRLPPTLEDGAATQFLQVLRDLGDFGNRTGAQLAATVGPESAERLAHLLAALPDGMLVANLDPAKLLTSGQETSSAIALLGQKIAHVHVADAVRNAGFGQGAEVPLGYGSLDFAAIIGGLEEYSYRGYFCLRPVASPTPLQDIQNAVQFLKNLD